MASGGAPVLLKVADILVTTTSSRERCRRALWACNAPKLHLNDHHLLPENHHQFILSAF
jgi:hypothetical protein